MNQEQEDELTVLESIFDSTVFTRSTASSDDQSPGGSFQASLALPPDFRVLFAEQDGALQEYQIAHLPPVTLNFEGLSRLLALSMLSK